MRVVKDSTKKLLRACAKGQYKDAITGTKGSGALARNDKQTIDKGGCTKFLFYVVATVALECIKLQQIIVTKGSERHKQIVQSGAVEETLGADDRKAQYTAVKVVATPDNATVGNLTTVAKRVGFNASSRQSSAIKMLCELRRSSKPDSNGKVKGHPDIHPYVGNPKPQTGAAAYNIDAANHYTYKPFLFFIQGFTMEKEDVPGFFADGRSLTSVLKQKGHYNIAYINKLEKKVTKTSIILALLLEHFGPRHYNNNRSDMDIKTLRRIMKEA